ncbi:MAG: hypothetical protein PVSMB8_03460 [Vulcanimicrobiaceae bacterium]
MLPPTASERPHRVDVADAFRAVAILCVVANHIALSSNLNVFGRPDDLAYLGTWGVDCFFVLSGFLLCRPYLAAILEHRPLPSTRAFLVRRFLRIYPLYALAVLVCALSPVVFERAPFPTAAVVTHLTFLNGFSPEHEFSLNGPLWTMAVDAQFYLVFPLVAIVVALCARRLEPDRRLQAVLVAIVVAVAGSLAYRSAAFAAFDLHVTGDRAGTTFVLARNVVGMAAAFAFGACVSLARTTLPAPRPVVARTAVVAGVAVLVALVWAGRTFVETRAYGIGYDLLGATSAALLLYGCACGAVDVPVLRRAYAPIAGAAALAYGVYLFHDLVLHWSLRALDAAHVERGSIAYAGELAACTLVSAGAIAVLARRSVEMPFLALRDRFGGSNDARRGAVAERFDRAEPHVRDRTVAVVAAGVQTVGEVAGVGGHGLRHGRGLAYVEPACVEVGDQA